jgi:L-fucose isomerase-like protein
MEDAGLPIKFAFELPVNAANDMLINYTVSGNGVFLTDYNIDYSQPQNLATVFNGASGSLTLKKGTKKIELSIIPKPNQQFEPNKTITITLAEGGDYELGANVTATGTILNDDNPTLYIFIGTGNYNVPANWDNNMVPPSQILIGDEVIIDPPNGGECILNVPVTVMPGAKFEVKPGKVLRINNSLQMKKKL